MKPFEPCAYYLNELDMLVVQIKDCSYTLDEKPPYLGGVMYENNIGRENAVGFQLYGIRSSLREDAILRLSQEKGAPPSAPPENEWGISELVQKIAGETEGGLKRIYGEAAKHVETILREHPHLSIRIPAIY